MEGNQTIITEFQFVGYPSSHYQRISMFIFFFLVYVGTIFSNLFIIVLVCMHIHLQTPMYVFICNLSMTEIFYITTTLPRMLSDLIDDTKTISSTDCIIQFYFFFSFGTTEDMFLLSMALDRYWAICKPLRYTAVMTFSTCKKIIVSCYMSAFTGNLIPLYWILGLSYCAPKEIDHFFCDFAPILKVACIDTQTIQFVYFSFCSTVICICGTMILISYVFIIRAILNIPSSTGRRKAFSTCSSHLLVVLLLYCTSGFVYMRPHQKKAFVFDKVITVFYSIGIPLVNPLIYSLRNKDMNKAANILLNRFV